MIVAKPLTAGNVVILKMRSGSEIVARLSQEFKEGDKTVAITKPLQLHPMQDEKGSLSLGFMPFSLAADDAQVFHIAVDNLLVNPFPARKEVSDSFMANTSSIVMPTH